MKWVSPHIWLQPNIQKDGKLGKTQNSECGGWDVYVKYRDW